MITSPIDQKLIEDNARKTTLTDLLHAEAVMEYAHANGFDEKQTAAICIRTGVRIGGKVGKSKADYAYKLLHEYQGREDKRNIPEKRIRDAAAWIRNPQTLTELAFYLIGRAAAIDAGTAEFPDDTTIQPDSKPVTTLDGNEEV